MKMLKLKDGFPEDKEVIGGFFIAQLLRFGFT